MCNFSPNVYVHPPCIICSFHGGNTDAYIRQKIVPINQREIARRFYFLVSQKCIICVA